MVALAATVSVGDLLRSPDWWGEEMIRWQRKQPRSMVTLVAYSNAVALIIAFVNILIQLQVLGDALSSLIKGHDVGSLGLTSQLPIVGLGLLLAVIFARAIGVWSASGDQARIALLHEKPDDAEPDEAPGPLTD